MGRERRRWQILRRSGTLWYGPPVPGATPVDPPAGVPDVLSDTEAHRLTLEALTAVEAALLVGDRHTADEALRHAVHVGVAPTALVFAGIEVGEQLVAARDRGTQIRADVLVDQESAEPDEVGAGPAGGDVAGQETDGDDEVVGHDTPDGTPPRARRARKATG